MAKQETYSSNMAHITSTAADEQKSIVDALSRAMDELMDDTASKTNGPKNKVPHSTPAATASEDASATTLVTGPCPHVHSHAHFPSSSTEAAVPAHCTKCCTQSFRRRPVFCGNERWMKHAGQYKTCTKKAKEVCPSCKLIEYCSDKCRFEHLNTHAPFCTPPFTAIRWAPYLVPLEKTPKEDQKPPTGTYLWGNTPACDILRFEDPHDYFEDINILWPVSGDLRNSLLTVCSLPSDYTKTCDITLNDPNVAIVIRNALILMITFVYPDRLEAAKTAMELWYCAALKEQTWMKLKFELLPFVERAYAKNMKGKATSQVSQRWTKCEASLRLTLTRRQWKLMLDILRDGDTIDFNKAMASRRAIIDSPTEKIRTNKKLLDMPVPYRRAHVRFLSTGMLLPFGQSIGEFTHVNPTLFSLSGEYLNGYDDTPLQAWHLPSVLKSGEQFDVLENDLYAALYQHVGSALFDFCIRLADLKLEVNFHLYSVETKKLDGTLGNNKAFHVNGNAFLQVGGYERE